MLKEKQIIISRCSDKGTISETPLFPPPTTLPSQPSQLSNSYLPPRNVPDRHHLSCMMFHSVYDTYPFHSTSPRKVCFRWALPCLFFASALQRNFRTSEPEKVRKNNNAPPTSFHFTWARNITDGVWLSCIRAYFRFIPLFCQCRIYWSSGGMYVLHTYVRVCIGHSLLDPGAR